MIVRMIRTGTIVAIVLTWTLANEPGRASGNAFAGTLPICSTAGVDTLPEFFSLADCIFDFEASHSLGELSPEEQAALSEYVSLLSSVRTKLLDALNMEVLPNLSPGKVADFESVVTDSFILAEIDAYTSFVSHTTVSQDKKKDAKKKQRESLKELINMIVDAVPDLFGLKDLVKTFLKIICEILEILGKI